jgi:hypothetical protein
VDATSKAPCCSILFDFHCFVNQLKFAARRAIRITLSAEAVATEVMTEPYQRRKFFVPPRQHGVLSDAAERLVDVEAFSLAR